MILLHYPWKFTIPRVSVCETKKSSLSIISRFDNETIFFLLLLQYIFRVYIFNFIEKITPEDIHRNAQKGTDIITTIKDQSQVMLKEQQQEPFENGQMSSAENSREDNGVEQNTAMTTHEISTAEIIDHNEQSSIVDDIVFKVIMRNFILDFFIQLWRV